jgi:hypothetical protein
MQVRIETENAVKSRLRIRGACLALFAMLCGACGSSGAVPDKTEALAADGGDLGKAFGDLVAAFKAGDKVRAAALLDPLAWNLGDKKPSWFAQFVDGMEDNHPVGGRRQGDRATLFLANSRPYYSMMNATRTANGWVFDSPLSAGSSFGETPRDCAASPTRFPCGAKSAPDAQVSGHVQSNKPGSRMDPASTGPRVMFDGLAVRMLDSKTRSLKSTRLLLSGTGINPQMVALSGDIGGVGTWLNYPMLIMDVAPDHRSAKLEYYDGFSRRKFDAADGLEIDTKTPNRIRGRFQADVSDLARFEIAFDISTISDCIDGAYRCGRDQEVSGDGL